MSQLTTNTTSLQAILDAVNALPEAGSGGGASVETCTVNINFTSSGSPDIFAVEGVTTTNGTLDVLDVEFTPSAGDTSVFTVEGVVKGTAVSIIGYGRYSIGGIACTDCELVNRYSELKTAVVKITSDVATVTISNAY